LSQWDFYTGFILEEDEIQESGEGFHFEEILQMSISNRFKQQVLGLNNRVNNGRLK
jgi:hypothetical protein